MLIELPGKGIGSKTVLRLWLRTLSLPPRDQGRCSCQEPIHDTIEGASGHCRRWLFSEDGGREDFTCQFGKQKGGSA